MNSPEESPLVEINQLWEKRWDSTILAQDEKAQLIRDYEGLYLVPALGLVTTFFFGDREGLMSSEEVIVLPLHRWHEPAVVFDELAAKLEALSARGLSSALGQPIAPLLGLTPARHQPGMFDPSEASIRRREASLARMNERFPAVAARMEKVYGLRLPRYLAVLAAFWHSLDEVERRGVSWLGRSPSGIMVWFEDGGLERQTYEGLDPRLDGRFRSDPPEMVTVMFGNSDGQHFGLWYDDPADLPTHLVLNYARDSAETWIDKARTPIASMAIQAHQCLHSTDERPPLSVYATQSALEWFAEADYEACQADPPAARWLEADRIPTLGTFGPALPPGAGSIRVGSPQERLKAWREQPWRVKKWIESARRDCAEGRPAAALTFGLDLHWLDAEEYRETARELLVMAYERLGRHAHAATIRVHYAHRDLGSVGVFKRADE